MRNIGLLVFCLLLFNLAFSQTETQKYYLNKSKNQKRTAWILLGTGAAAFTIGAIIDNAHKGENTQQMTGGFFEIGGIICSLTSIPFFFTSFKNKKRQRDCNSY